jgi:putative membrane protein
MQYYYWIVVFHIMSFMSWMAMLFYLPRLFVYHVEHKEKKEFVEVVKIQEYKLYKYIGVPAKIATIASGFWMIYLNHGILQSGNWMYAKLLLAGFLTIYSFSLEFFRKELEKDRCTKSGTFFRAYNEVPTLLAIFIVIFVVLKPF